jgi:hypothetical protein
MNPLLPRFVIGLLLGASALAEAAPPHTTVSWVTPTGTASPTDSIPLWLRLSVDATAASALVLDGTAANFDLTADLPGWASVQFVDSVHWIGCQGSLIPSTCFDPASLYRFDFNTSSNHNFGHYAGGHTVPLNLTLLPGQSEDFLVGSFVPQNGPVPVGHYTLENAGLQLDLSGLDANGQPLFTIVGLGSACDGSPNCLVFSRDVVAIPEPATASLLGFGLLALAGARRRR